MYGINDNLEWKNQKRRGVEELKFIDVHNAIHHIQTEDRLRETIAIEVVDLQPRILAKDDEQR